MSERNDVASTAPVFNAGDEVVVIGIGFGVSLATYALEVVHPSIVGVGRLVEPWRPMMPMIFDPALSTVDHVLVKGNDNAYSENDKDGPVGLIVRSVSMWGEVADYCDDLQTPALLLVIKDVWGFAPRMRTLYQQIKHDKGTLAKSCKQINRLKLEIVDCTCGVAERLLRFPSFSEH